MAISTSIERLVRSSGTIFTGTVIHGNRSTVPTLRPDERLAVVKVERVLQSTLDLPDEVTVKMEDAHRLEAGERAVIFSHLWIVGEGIAVREEAHLDTGQAEAVAVEIALLPLKLLSERIASALLIVAGDVVDIVPSEPTPFDRRPGEWAVAEVEVAAVLKGKPRKTVHVHFPTDRHPVRTRAPHFRRGQRGIFLLHHPSRISGEGGLEREDFVALDPLDFQPEQQWHTVRELIDVP